MPFAFLFPLLSIGLCLIAARHGGWTWLLLWPAVSFLLVGIAYALAEPRLFGKRPDGTVAFWAMLLLLPYLLLAWALWRVVRWAHRIGSCEPYASQITPTLWLSRRLLTREIPPGVTCIVDTTCEFPAAPGLTRAVSQYICVPTLDYGTPKLERSLELLTQLRAHNGGILIHCAQGHGRSALLAAAFLVATGAAKDAQDALGHIKRKRPDVRLAPNQRAALQTIINKLQSPVEPASRGLNRAMHP